MRWGEKRFMETETPVGWTERAREDYRGTKKKVQEQHTNCIQ